MISGMEAELPAASAGACAMPVDRDLLLGDVYRCHYGRLVGLARLLLDDRAQAEEVVQEAFARTYAGWHRVRDQSDPLPYVRKAVVNISRGSLRKRRVASQHLAEVVRDEPSVVHHEPSAEAMAITATNRRVVAAAVRQLPKRQRQCVALRYLLDCTTSETASTLGISEGAVKTHLHRALVALTRSLETIR
jgi:RNA polymerase sigma-70 factor (sigma-E family)